MAELTRHTRSLPVLCLTPLIESPRQGARP